MARISSSGRAVVQTALFTVGRATATLFDKAALQLHVRALRTRPLVDTNAAPQQILNWVRTLSASVPKPGRSRRRALKPLGELNLEQSFNSLIMCGIFGYVLPGTADGGFTILPKQSSDTGTPDATIGLFSDGAFTPLGTIELKPPFTDLDAPQNRESKETPVEQAFRAARSIPTVRWIIVSNLDEIRLYHISQPSRFYRTYLSHAVDPMNVQLHDDFAAALSLLHKSQLIGTDILSPSNVDRLLESTELANAAITGGFYDLFTQARADLYEAILKELSTQGDSIKRLALAKAQKLLDRIIFIRFCEDHPFELLPRGRLQRVVQTAPEIPGRNTKKIYQACKGYFDEIRLGNVHGATYRVFAYDGELFDDDPVLDHIDLDDELFRRRYRTRVGDRERGIVGPFGFWEYNFSAELNEHLLGHIYERSLADLERGDLPSDIRTRTSASAIRARYGIWYTPETLTNYLASVALTPVLEAFYKEAVSSLPASADRTAHRAAYEAYYNAILQLRILDPACGSGAFLVSCFDILAAACRGARVAIERLSDIPHPELLESADNRLMHECLYGIDLNPEAVAITKLALWLKTAYKQETNVDLSDRIVAANSLDDHRQFEGVEFNIVIGNPPWGAEWTEDERKEYRERFGFEREDFRSEEAFVRLAFSYLKPGGILAYVLPDTILYPEKLETRKILLNAFTIRELHQLGPEWFTAENRMSTLVLCAEYNRPADGTMLRSFTLVDKDRKAAIAEEFSLFQAEAKYAEEISQDRCRQDGPQGYEIRLFQYAADDGLMAKIATQAVPLHRNQEGDGPLTERGRGIELNKDGLIIQCPSCGMFLPPPLWNAREERYETKECPNCQHTFRFESAAQRIIVHDRPLQSSGEMLYVDGDSIHRYEPLHYEALELGVAGIAYKDAGLYRGPKMLLRQAGVGINVVLDPTDAYCPQSVYVYRTSPAWAEKGYSDAFLVGVLSSRILHYYLFKRFGEIDSARAHVKVTHERLADMPMPLLDAPQKRAIAKDIAERVHAIRDTRSVDERYPIDLEIEERVASLFALTPAERAYINGQFGLVHENETVRALFPHGTPEPRPLADDPELFS